MPSRTTRPRAAEDAPPRRGTSAPVPRPAAIFDPVARALDVIGDRWSLVLLRQLMVSPKGFQELRVRTGIAPRVLSQRLRQLAADGFVAQDEFEGRAAYTVTERGRTLEPVIAELALWWIHEGIDHLAVDVGRFTETSPQSVFESLPFLLREERARDARVVFEIRLTGEGGGVWRVEIDRGRCEVSPGFAEGADVRYTAEARVWCGVALGLLDAREAIKAGDMIKEGGRYALDHYFHQVSKTATRK